MISYVIYYLCSVLSTPLLNMICKNCEKRAKLPAYAYPSSLSFNPVRLLFISFSMLSASSRSSAENVSIMVVVSKAAGCFSVIVFLPFAAVCVINDLFRSQRIGDYSAGNAAGGRTALYLAVLIMLTAFFCTSLNLYKDSQYNLQLAPLRTPRPCISSRQVRCFKRQRIKNTSNVFTFPWLNCILSTDFAVKA